MYVIERTQQLPITVQQAWDFLSSPLNLKTITPEYMGFEITNGEPGSMYAGQIITYKVRPMLGIPLNWTTEITHVQAPQYFVDEQRFGPYSFWHHKHFIEELPDGAGVEMRDVVHYKLPLGFLGGIVNSLIVKRQLNAIFDYRFKKLEEMFGVAAPLEASPMHVA